MQTFPYSALSEPESREHFSSAMAAFSAQAGADRFLVVRLHGDDMREVVHVIHNGGEAAEDRLTTSLHWTVERMLDGMRQTRAPKVFGGADDPGPDVAGFHHGIGAVARVEDGGCVVYLGTRSAVGADDAKLWTLASTAQVCAQYACEGLKGRAAKVCPLTPQELACLRHYMTSQNMKDAARTLGISVRTLENHLDRARIKCGVDSSLAATMMAIREGWIDLKELRALEATG